jgi:thioredoxin-like negative regulator of GroEL
LLAGVALAQTADPAYPALTSAFEALRSHEFDRSVAEFRKAAGFSPDRTDIRKNLAYTLLKTGDSDGAREEFGVAMKLDANDFQVALEYAFLCYEAHDDASARKSEARRIFLRVRDLAPDATLRATAAQAFRNVDEPLDAGIRRWQQALATSAPNFSAHYELAQLAEQRDIFDLAAANYLAAYRVLPERKSVLLDLARVDQARGNAEGARAALLAASRGGEPRAAELARERMPERYPYVYEFRQALAIDPKNQTLHRELAFLLLAMSESGQVLRQEAEVEFEQVVAGAPGDYLAAAQLGLLFLADHRDHAAIPILRDVMKRADPATANRARIALNLPTVLEERPETQPSLSPMLLGERSYNAGFLKDALRYFTQAWEANPVDSQVALKLGWTNNLLHLDNIAVRWFDQARHSADPSIAAEAQKAWKNLRPGSQRFRTTVWMYPMLSTRWRDMFGYGQVKTELRIGKLPIRPYLSMRFVGDARVSTGGFRPQPLSESAFILGGGVATTTYKGLTGWFETGAALNYSRGHHWHDTRGGVSWARNIGASLGSAESGGFFESTADSVFITRFGNDLINISQNKAGYKTAVAGVATQFFWTANMTVDSKHRFWANFVETGPGFRLHPPGLPPSVTLTVTALRGVYLVNSGNLDRPNFNDIRAGVWYAFTK